MNNLAWLYQNEFHDYAKAEQYYLRAIEHGHVSAMFNLADLYLEQKWKKQDALKWARRVVENEKNEVNANLLAAIYVWNNQTENAIQISETFMNDDQYYEAHENRIIFYLTLLLSKKYYSDVSVYFETTKLDLKERLKPLYYTLLYFLEDQDYNKLPPELAESVHAIIEKVNQMAIEYA